MSEGGEGCVGFCAKGRSCTPYVWQLARTGGLVYPPYRTPCPILASCDVHLLFTSALGRETHMWCRKVWPVCPGALICMTGEKKSNLNKCRAVHSVLPINCSVVASFGRATWKAVKASKKSQRTQCWGDEGRSKFNGLHELSGKPSADFSIFSGTFSF